MITDTSGEVAGGELAGGESAWDRFNWQIRWSIRWQLTLEDRHDAFGARPRHERVWF